MDGIGLGVLQLLRFAGRILIPSLNLHALSLTAGGSFGTSGRSYCTYIHIHIITHAYGVIAANTPHRRFMYNLQIRVPNHMNAGSQHFESLVLQPVVSGSLL